MRPSDTKPTSGPCEPEHKSYDTDRNCQGSSPAAFEKAGQNSSANLASLYFQYLSQPSQDRLDELMKYCLIRLERKVGYYVHCEGVCPAYLAPATFVTDAFSRACYKFWAGIHALRSPQLLTLWINRIAYSAVVEELREVIRRTKKPCSLGPIEIVHPDGTLISVLDRAGNRDAATRYGRATVGQTEVVKDLVYRDILGKLFQADGGTKRERDGIELLRVMLACDLTVDEIAAQRGMKKDKVLRLVRSARKRLRETAKTEYDFTAEDL